MGTPAPGPPPRTAPALPRPAPCAPGARRGRRTRPRAQLGADRSRHPEADEAHLLANIIRTLANPLARKSGSGPTSSGSDSRSTCTLETSPPNCRKQDMRMLSRPLAPRGKRLQHSQTCDPAGSRNRRSDRARSDRQDKSAPRGRTASVADQPAGELPAAATIEAGSTTATTEDIAAVPAETGPPPAAPEGAAAVVTRHREHRFPGRRRPEVP